MQSMTAEHPFVSPQSRDHEPFLCVASLTLTSTDNKAAGDNEAQSTKRLSTIAAVTDKFRLKRMLYFMVTEQTRG